MFKRAAAFSQGVVEPLRIVSMIYIGALACLAVGATLLSAVGVVPWLSFTVTGWSWGVAPGMALQIGLALLSLALLMYLPGALRVLQLQNEHRKFYMKMEDVTRAYHVAHAADRQGAFNLSSEFDSVRERMLFMMNHPHLSKLEPDVIDAAAQMSHVSRDLASVYSDQNVERARAVLRQRQVEVLELQERIEQARTMTDELQRWQGQVAVEQSVANAQIDKLKEDLTTLMPELLGEKPKAAKKAPAKRKTAKTAEAPKGDDTNVVTMAKKSSAKVAE